MDTNDTTSPPAAAPADDETARIRRAFERASARLDIMKKAGTLDKAGLALRQSRQLADPTDPTGDSAFRDRAELAKMEGPDGAGVAERTARAASLGAAKAVLETKDFLVGEPADADKSGLRQSFESQDRALGQESMGYSLASGVSQMAVGLIGAGKLLAPLKVLGEGSAILRTGMEIAKGALAGAVVLDPHEDRLSNLVEEFPDLQNPVTNYLAADPDDTAAEGRFKNSLESIGADLALVGVVKTIKYLRGGDKAAAAREIAKLEKYRLRNANGFGPPEAPSVGGEVRAPEMINPEEEVRLGIWKDTPRPRQALPEAPTAKGPSPAKTEGVPPSPAQKTVGTEPPINSKTGQPIPPTDETPPVPTQEIPDDDIAKILKDTQADAKAVETYGSRAQAQEAGHDFGKKVPLPWQKLHTPGNVESLLQRSAKILADRFNMAKGGKVLTDAHVKSLANELGAQFNEDPALIIGQLTEAGEQAKLLAPQMEAALRLGNRMFIDADDLATKISNGNLQEFGGNVHLATQEFMARLGVSFDTMASANSMLSNSGRTLRLARSQFRFRPADIAKLKGMDPQQVITVMRKAGGDPKKVAMLLNETWRKRVLDEATWHLTNGLLWMWPTHLVNMTSNAFMLAARPTEKVFGSAALRLITKDAGKRAELSSLSRQGLREYHYTITSLADGWSNAVEAFRRGDSILNPQNTEFFDGSMTGLQTAPLQWKPWNSVWCAATNKVRLSVNQDETRRRGCDEGRA
ncbi:hypothetical protein LGH82_21070 [Mesorhizobium sp. PAMC28654]|uniref:hypothetical protein n=1 Tax=Mesorhizobium sp. PAMC28654 TaxID=2880934 RepID=UPI001D0A64BC|nr:hypothetical protein [Mesorhizobium sp. PAMC28654]UDL87656.1 hypothetical protein LGH82_21070 [Mesorhizobium sp. PAMC28654]